MPAIPDILLVEDDEELSSVVSNRLRESGYAVRTAFTGPEALECVSILYYTVLYCTILYYIVLYCAILY